MEGSPILYYASKAYEYNHGKEQLVKDRGEDITNSNGIVMHFSQEHLSMINKELKELHNLRTNTLSIKAPNLIIFMEGGVIQDIKSDKYTNVVVVDADIDDIPTEELTSIDNEESYVYRPLSTDDINPEFVNQILRQANI
ncbi:hypothetical protein [Virgibacillus salexigens]|uniref:Uncharacterized protein n=1 Tax=Virgibacillus massiliensis TaxID=1462526 RepID=A0A024QIA6_9BACI|nr:hypothetical protein [Virgibacillus massiliensis]CDQ41915.1 hypothetical protein BN990_04294 [Virgibacillus massiliensis]